jgi:glycosyltransferase involved in cell wall biosynthesis
MSSHHVLFTNRVYPPASGATGAVLSEMAGALVERGWRVTVVTGPAEGAPDSEVTDAGVHVERVGALQFTRASTWKRALAYLSHYPAMLTRMLRLPRPDVVVTKTDPPLQLVLGALYHRITGVPAVHWAQDLYPEIAEALDVIPTDGWFANLLRRVSSTAMRQHDHVVAVGRCMQERITARGIPARDVSVVPNWPPASVTPIPHDENPFRADHDLGDDFVVMYSGNMGLAHPFDAVMDAAAALQSDDRSVRFLFIGEGPRKADLQTQADRRGLDTVSFFPFQPYETLAQSLSAADLHLVTMENEAEGLVVPSKMYGALAAGRPALFLGPDRSEAARLVREHRCGTVMPAPSGATLADAIRDWYDRADREQAGRRARSAVENGFREAVDGFDDLLRRTVDAPSSRRPVTKPSVSPGETPPSS